MKLARLTCGSCAEFKHDGGAHIAVACLQGSESDEDFVTVGFRLCSQVVVFQTPIDNGKRLLFHPDWKSLPDLVAPFFALTARPRDGIALACFHEIRGYCPNIVGKIDVF